MIYYKPRVDGFRSTRDLGWVSYDEQFRLRKARVPQSSWADVDVELWLLYVSRKWIMIYYKPRVGGFRSTRSICEWSCNYSHKYNALCYSPILDWRLRGCQTWDGFRMMNNFVYGRPGLHSHRGPMLNITENCKKVNYDLLQAESGWFS
jgi:hypothetical protein